MSNEETVVSVLKSSNANCLEKALSPEQLVTRCAQAGMIDGKAIEAALVSLIDQDIVDYEMNDQTDVTHIWLL